MVLSKHDRFAIFYLCFVSFKHQHLSFVIICGVHKWWNRIAPPIAILKHPAHSAYEGLLCSDRTVVPGIRSLIEALCVLETVSSQLMTARRIAVLYGDKAGFPRSPTWLALFKLLPACQPARLISSHWYGFVRTHQL